MTPHAPIRSDSRRRRGFTIVELLVVIGIIALLVGISFFAINKARRSANMARIKADFVAISTAIDQFKADHKALPGMVPVPPPVRDYKYNALGSCLIGPADQETDGADGPGFRYQTAPNGSNPAPVKLWSAYLDPSKFQVREQELSGVGKVWHLLDAYGTPIVYLPKRKTGVRPSVGLLGDTEKRIVGFDVRDIELVLSSAGAQNGLRMGLGDLNANNKIDDSETVNFAGDYVLMSAGPDAEFFEIAGSAPSPEELKAFQKADDVYNFDR